MNANTLFSVDSPVAIRQPKTDRLVLSRLLKQAMLEKALDEDAIAAAHEILIHWAELEASGRLKRLKESQMQGKFLD